MTASYVRDSGWWFAILGRKKKALNKALLEPCHRLKDLPPNEELPFLSPAPLRLLGIYPYPMSNGQLPQDDKNEKEMRNDERLQTLYQSLGLFLASAAPCLGWTWVALSGKQKCRC